MFIRNIDQLSAADGAYLFQSIVFAQNQWNSLGSGPQFYDLNPNIGDSNNYLTPKTTSQIFVRTNALLSAVVLFCSEVTLPDGDHCTPSTLEAVNAQWTETWINVDRSTPVLCMPCLSVSQVNYLLAHELGHVLGLAHHGESNSTLMGSNPPTDFSNFPLPGPVEAGSTSDCKAGGNQDNWGIRCIYDWYNCGTDSDCDGISSGSDNCPVAPNETQRDSDGEVLDLAPYHVFDDVTNITAYDTLGDICDSDDDGDGLSTSLELVLPCSFSTGPTDPLNDDTDNDRIIDSVECLLGTNPKSSSSKPATSPDSDGDGLADGYETIVFGTNPNDLDSDDDRPLDGSEVLKYRSDPKSPDSDGRRCDDGREIGSVNNDYFVSSSDLSIVSQHFGPYPASNHILRDFDFNRDGAITSGDLASVAAVFGNCP